jgi:hypothetical protein
MEAEAARAAALLVSDDARGGIEYDGQDAIPPFAGSPDDAPGVPATWRLPTPPGTGGVSAEGMTPNAAARFAAGYAAVGFGASGYAGSQATVAQSPGSQAAGHGAAQSASAQSTLAQSPEAESFVLPDPATMPPITPEQRERLEALNSRIEQLKAELATAMAEAEDVLARATPRRPEPTPRPEFVDRRL